MRARAQKLHHSLTPSAAALCAPISVMQPEGQGVLIQPEYIHLHKEMWARQTKVLQRYSLPAQQVAQAKRAAAAASLPPDLQVCVCVLALDALSGR
eukprot:scaffold230612_cov23-Tisochrysis_lutea.AAC.3